MSSPMKARSLWPRGRFNGRRITGLTVHIRFDITTWTWLPRVKWQFGEVVVRWLFVYTQAAATYHWAD